MRYLAVMLKEPGSDYSVIVPGCYSAGEAMAEALELLCAGGLKIEGRARHSPAPYSEGQARCEGYPDL